MAAKKDQTKASAEQAMEQAPAQEQNPDENTGAEERAAGGDNSPQQAGEDGAAAQTGAASPAEGASRGENGAAPGPGRQAGLFTPAEMADKYRIPGWQSAALHTMMGWASGKIVSEEEYKNALARLKNRRIGG